MPDGGAVSGPILGEIFLEEVVFAEVGAELFGEYALGGELFGAGGGFGGIAGDGILGYAGDLIGADVLGNFGANALEFGAVDAAFGGAQALGPTAGFEAIDAAQQVTDLPWENPFTRARELSMPKPFADFTHGDQTWTQAMGDTGATSTGLTPWGEVRSALNSPEARLASNAYSMYSGLNMADKMGQLGANIGRTADPWGAQGGRGQAATQLQGAINGSQDYTNNPMYAARLQAAQRQMASQGYNGSGNAAVAAANAGGAGYNDYINQMSNLAGVGNGAQTGAIQMSGLNNQAEMTSRALATGAYGATRYAMQPDWFKQTPA